MIVADIIRALEQYPWDAKVMVLDIGGLPKDAVVVPDDKSKPAAENMIVDILPAD